MVNSSTWIPNFVSQSPSLSDLFNTSDASICSTMAFLPLGNSDHVTVSVSSDFPSNSQWDALIAYDYSHADWDGLSSHLRDELLMSEVILYSSEYKVQLSQASTRW